MGIESGRLHFSWISSAEAGKFVDLVKEITDQVMQLGPADKLIKELPIVNEYLAGSGQVAASRKALTISTILTDNMTHVQW
jgi:hypothetical protein